MKNKQAITPYYGMVLIALFMIFVFGCTNISGSDVESKNSALSRSEMETSIETARSSPSANASDAGVSKDSGIPDSGTGSQTDGGTSSNELFSDNAIILEQYSRPAQIVNKYNSSTAIERIRVVTVNHEVFKQSSIKLNLFNDETFIVEKGKMISAGPNMNGWISSFDLEKGEAIFAVVNGLVEGSFKIGNKYYRIRPMGKPYHVIIDFDESKIAQAESGPKDWIDREELKDGLEESITRLRKAGLEPNSTSNGFKVGPTPFRILLAYTTAAAAYVESYDSTMAAESYYFMAVMIASYYYSDIEQDVALEWVGVTELDYEECAVGTFRQRKSSDLNRFALYGETNILCGIVTGGPYMDDIHIFRNQYAADVIVLIRNTDPDEGGMALLIGAEDYTEAAAVSSNYNTELEATRIAQGMLLAHEVGHLFGCCHNVEDCEENPSCDPETDDQCYESYEHGYCNIDATPKFRTIMAQASYCAANRADFYSDTGWDPSRGVEDESECGRKLTEKADDVAEFVSTFDVVNLLFDIKSGEYGYAVATDSIYNDSTLTVEEDGTLYMKADTITFKTGFHAESGSVVWAGKDITP